MKRDLDGILSLAQRSVPGCDAGSVTLIVEGRPQTEAVIDRVVVAVDLAQYEMQESPCLQAAAENRPIRVDLIPINERFRRFADRVRDTGVQGSLSLPVVVGGVAAGSLDLHSWTPFSFDASSQDLGAVLAAQVGVAVAESRLLAGSEDVAVIAQRLADEEEDIAVPEGMLMVLEPCTLEQAAALIRNSASSEAETLVGIARRVIAEVASQRRRQDRRRTGRATRTDSCPPSREFDRRQPVGPARCSRLQGQDLVLPLSPLPVTEASVTGTPTGQRDETPTGTVVANVLKGRPI